MPRKGRNQLFLFAYAFCGVICSSPASAQTNQCESLFDSWPTAATTLQEIGEPARTSSEQIKAEYDFYANGVGAQIAKLLNMPLAERARIERAVHVVLSNAYLERTLYDRAVREEMADLAKVANSRRIDGSEIDTIFLELLVGGRNFYFDHRNIVDPTNITAINFQEGFDHRKYDTFSTFTARRKISRKDLEAEVPKIDQTWRRFFDDGRNNLPQIAMYEVADIPGTFVAIFNDHVYMNSVFSRASEFIEGTGELARGNAIFGSGAGGHDLTGPDLVKFFSLATKRYKSDLEISTNPNYLRRLKFEREFFVKIIMPTIAEREAKNVVFLAVSSDTSSSAALSHEMWHARYFTDESYRARVDHYYAQLSKADKDAFKQAIAYIGYDLENEYLMRNEFQAYMLENYDSPGVGPQAQNRQAVFRRLRVPFRTYIFGN